MADLLIRAGDYIAAAVRDIGSRILPAHGVFEWLRRLGYPFMNSAQLANARPNNTYVVTFDQYRNRDPVINDALRAGQMRLNMSFTKALEQQYEYEVVATNSQVLFEILDFDQDDEYPDQFYGTARVGTWIYDLAVEYPVDRFDNVELISFRDPRREEGAPPAEPEQLIDRERFVGPDEFVDFRIQDRDFSGQIGRQTVINIITGIDRVFPEPH